MALLLPLHVVPLPNLSVRQDEEDGGGDVARVDVAARARAARTRVRMDRELSALRDVLGRG